MPIYRRGALYWLRRSAQRGLENDPITIRISLRTSCARAAKVRAAALELEWDRVMADVQTSLRTVMTGEDLTRVYHLATKAKLDQIIVQQAATPMQADVHAAFNRVYANLFALIAGSRQMPVPDAILVDELVEAGFDRAEAERVHMTLQLHRRRASLAEADLGIGADADLDDPEECPVEMRAIAKLLGPSLTLELGGAPIGTNRVTSYLQQAGVRTSRHNREAATRVVAAAYRDACVQASKLLGRPTAADALWSLPDGLLEMLGIENPDRSRQEADVPASTPSTSAKLRAATREAGDLQITALAAAAIKARTTAREWDPERERDIAAAVKLFVAANGDLPFSTIRQHHLAATVALFSSLPTRYGFARKDPVSGQHSQESIEEALSRGAALRQQWDADPVAAERQLLPTVGLGPVTHNKHLTWLSALVTYAKAAGKPAPKGLDFTILRIKGSKARGGSAGGMKKKNEALPAFALSDIRHLFDAPIWNGCAGLLQRFEPGPVVFHDAWYWCPLIIALHGCRSEEGAGLAVEDVVIDVSVPFLHIRKNSLRRVKTAAADRRVPIHPKLIELGFVEYVRAMIAAGHTALFPELLHDSSSFDRNFYKIFESLRACQFPAGTSRKKGRKDCDVRSIRSRCVSHLRDVGCPKQLAQAIVGHEMGDVTSDIYEEDPDPALLLPWVERLGDLVPELPFRPLNLRPAEWQKFGSPRSEPLRVCRRPQLLRGRGYDEQDDQ